MKTQLIEALKQASKLCWDNVNKADNIDLHNMGEKIDDFIDQLNEIDDFEKYEDEGPEYDSAGFTEADRFIDESYQVKSNIVFDDIDTHHCDDLDCNCPI